MILDESTDVITNLNNLFKEANAKFEVTEELAPVTSLCGRAKGKNIFKEVKKTLIQYNLK